MGTTKKLLVLCMVLLMGIVSVMPSTFSWYDHSVVQVGDRMSYEREELPVSAGTISVSTKKYKMVSDKKIEENKTPEEKDYKEVYYDIKGNKEYNGDAISEPQTIAANTSQYYGTTITNSANSPAYVNLYLQSIKNNNNFFIGTMEPSLRDKGVSSSVHLKNKNSIRVYFQWHNANNWNDGWIGNNNSWNSSGNAKIYVVCTDKNGYTYCDRIDESSHKLTPDANNSTQVSKLGNERDRTYFADLRDDTVSFYFATDGNKSGITTSGSDIGKTTMNWYRTNTITDVQAERCYYLTGVADDTTFCAQYSTIEIPGGISVMKYFDNAEINQGQKTYISLTKGIHYTGATVSYSGSGGLTVSTGSGMISRTGTDEGTVTTTITGSLGDTKTVSTSVTTPETVDAMPLAMNIKVPANESTLVVWYVRNESPSAACTFNSIYYTK